MGRMREKAKQVIERLDEIGTMHNSYEYGLPMHDDTITENMVNVILDVFQPREPTPDEPVMVDIMGHQIVGLRDYFAAEAPPMPDQWWEDSKADGYHIADAQAAWAFFYANEMMKERREGQ